MRDFLLKIINFLSFNLWCFYERILKIGKPELYIKQINGLKFEVRKKTFDNYIINAIVKNEEYPLKIEKNYIVLDLGANIGSFSILASKQCKKVISYEPDPESFKQLKKNLELNNCTNVKTYQIAVTNKVGFSKFNKYSSDIRNNLVGHSSKTINVKTISLKEVFKDNGLKKIDLIKCDVEGAEYLIFNEKNKDLLKKVGKIELEYHLISNTGLTLKKFFEKRKKLTNLFKEAGFKVKDSPEFLFLTLFPVGKILAIRNSEELNSLN